MEGVMEGVREGCDGYVNREGCEEGNVLWLREPVREGYEGYEGGRV